MSLVWPVVLPAESGQSSPSSSHEDPNDEHLESALPAPPHPSLEVGYSSITLSSTRWFWIGTHVSVFLMAVFNMFPGTLEVFVLGL